MALSIRSCDLPDLAAMYAARELRFADRPARPMDVYIPQEQGDLLYSICREVRPAFTIEVGMANGLSTAFIARALADNGLGTHIAIDPYQRTDWQSSGLDLLRTLGLQSLVRLVELPSHQALPMLEREGVVADLVFIDGAHLFDFVMTDFLCSDRLLRTGGLVAFDDSDWPAVRSVLRFAITNRHYEVAFPEIVIEPERHRPSKSAAALRAFARWVPRLGEKLAPDFRRPDHELGLSGRCVVLRKLAADDRDSQSRGAHRAF
jgi:predicted O-methyltransferase YrrM